MRGFDRPNSLTEVSLRRVAVELGEILAQAKASGMPHADAWMEDWGRGE
jgi:hypothetical protein